MSNEGQQGQKLIELLKLQIGNYRKALDLEEKLAKLIADSKFEEIRQNTEAKIVLMSSVDEVYSSLIPLIDQHRGTNGSLESPESEKLRQEAFALLEEISKLQERNLLDIAGSRKKMLDGFKVAKQAKQVARGYKRTKSIYRSKFDTKS